MHVLVVPSWYPEAPSDIKGSFFREQAIALANANCKVGVIFPQRRSIRKSFTTKCGVIEENDCGVATLRKLGVSWLSFVPRGNSILWLNDGLMLYQRYVNRYGAPDIIHAHSALYGGVLAQKIFNKFGVPYVLTEHSTAYPRNILNIRQKKLAYLAVKNASRRFAVSRPLSDLLQNYFGLEAGSWEVIPNIVQKNFYNYPLRGVGYKGNKFSFINIAFLTKNKAIDDLLAAYGKAFADDETTRLVIGGDGVERDHLERLAREIGIKKHVQFLGSLDRKQVLEHVSAADAFVLSSHYETFGVVVAEALALGKPVIATRCGGPEEIVREQDGMLVEPGDINAIAKAMQYIRLNIEQYDSEQIRRNCINRYGEDVVTASLLANYRNVIDG